MARNIAMPVHAMRTPDQALPFVVKLPTTASAIVMNEVQQNPVKTNAYLLGLNELIISLKLKRQEWWFEKKSKSEHQLETAPAHPHAFNGSAGSFRFSLFSRSRSISFLNFWSMVLYLHLEHKCVRLWLRPTKRVRKLERSTHIFSRRLWVDATTALEWIPDKRIHKNICYFYDVFIGFTIEVFYISDFVESKWQPTIIDNGRKNSHEHLFGHIAPKLTIDFFTPFPSSH